MATASLNSVEYVTRTPQGVWRVAESRVSLESIIQLHRAGHTPQEIVESFPTLRLEQIFGAIAFYLRYQPAIDSDLDKQRQLWEAFEQESGERNRELRDRILARAARNDSAAE